MIKTFQEYLKKWAESPGKWIRVQIDGIDTISGYVKGPNDISLQMEDGIPTTLIISQKLNVREEPLNESDSKVGR